MLCFKVSDSFEPPKSKWEGYERHALKSWVLRDPVGKNDGLPGEMGKAVQIPKEKEEEKKEKFKINQFNLLASEMISLNRSLADVRLSA
jgi:polypeptide N-acetylgalactosaminyltransferase